MSSAAENPNITLVMCDDLGWSDNGFNGGKLIRTPGQPNGRPEGEK